MKRFVEAMTTCRQVDTLSAVPMDALEASFMAKGILEGFSTSYKSSISAWELGSLDKAAPLMESRAGPMER